MANKEGARKSGKFIAVCTTPDVCKTPVGNTVVPIPYQIIANLNDSASTSPNVNFGGDPAFILSKSIVTKVIGDEPGTAGGVKSGTNRATVEPIEGSTNFYVNKRPVVRHGDKCKMNNGNTLGKFIYQGGGGSKGGSSNPPIKPETPAEKSFLDKMGGLYDKLNITPLQELKKGIQGGIDKVVEASGYNPIVMGIGAAATAANEVFVPDNLTDFTPGKLLTKGKKAYSAVKGAVKTKKTLTAALQEEKRLVEETIKRKEAARKAAQEAAKKKSENGTTIKGNSKKYYRNKNERRKALKRDAEDQNSRLTKEQRDYIKEHDGKKVPKDCEVSHEKPLYTKNTIEGKKALDTADNMKTMPTTEHRNLHKTCGVTYHDYPR